MKYLVWLMLIVPSLSFANDDFVLLLVDPDDQEMMEALGDTSLPESQPKDLNELQKYLEANRLPMNDRYQRLSDLAFKRQQRVIELLDDYLEAAFNPQDPEANPNISVMADEIVSLTFRAMTEKDFYEILYVINQTWLDHLDEVERFAYLDKKMGEEDLRRERKRQKLRKIATSVTSLGGAALGAYGGYLMSKKAVPIVAEEKTLSLLLKWSFGRVPMIIVGASVGAAAGSYLGFLGSNWLVGRHHIYLDPIDGNEDLRDILDIVDELP